MIVLNMAEWAKGKRAAERSSPYFFAKRRMIVINDSILSYIANWSAEIANYGSN